MHSKPFHVCVSLITDLIILGGCLLCCSPARYFQVWCWPQIAAAMLLWGLLHTAAECISTDIPAFLPQDTDIISFFCMFILIGLRKNPQIYKCGIAPGNILFMNEKLMSVFSFLSFQVISQLWKWAVKARRINYTKCADPSVWVNSLENHRNKTFWFIFFNLVANM